MSSVTRGGRTTTRCARLRAWSESISAEREPGSTKDSSFSYSPADGLTGSALGSRTASSTRAYTADGMVASLVWSAAGTTVRSHTNLAYDLGGLRTAETVNVVHPATATGTDPGGPASYSYDLARRLVSYTSPYKAEPLDTAEPTVAYGLDDGANIANATTTVGGQTRVSESSTYPGGRLATRSSTSTPPLGAPATADSTFSYSPLGEETQRTTTAAGITSTTTTGYDAAGHVSKVVTVTPTETEGVDYVYDGADHLLARRSGGETTLYFYWGPGSTLAEETDGAGLSLARYVVDGAEPIAQHTFRRILGGGKDPTDTAGTWAWILDDPAANAATTVGDDGAVLSQAAFDPYGVPEATGNSKAPGPDAKTSLGFQSALTDPTTDKVILGPRQYDPKTARFTNPDVFVGAGADVALGTDPLTGNRYLFAGANPVSYYEDGHCAFGKERKVRKRVGTRLGPRYEVWIENPASYGGGYYAARFDTLPVYKTETKCDRSLGSVVEAVRSARHVISAVGTAASIVAAGSAGVGAACLASVVAAACSVPALGIAGAASGVSAASTLVSTAFACTGQRQGCEESFAELTLAFAASRTAKYAARGAVTFGLSFAEAVTSIVAYCSSGVRSCRL